jgi:L-alanine-DL-glutamate epimerase-like enolase superfamily enzyme
MIPYELEPDLFTDQRHIENGFLLRPEKPGIGITMNKIIENKYKFDENAVYSCVVVDRGQPEDDYWKL